MCRQHMLHAHAHVHVHVVVDMSPCHADVEMCTAHVHVHAHLVECAVCGASPPREGPRGAARGAGPGARARGRVCVVWCCSLHARVVVLVSLFRSAAF